MATNAPSRPPLPARPSSNIGASSTVHAGAVYGAMTAKDDIWSAQDPRSSSTQSLVPSESNEQQDRRRLLLIFIHGFMGDETSFRSFPAHVHNLLTVLLVETHVVHTKIYPRYRSKRKITFARDDFSSWLEPHEGPKIDVVLLGHSMGGLLSAEVVLKQPSALGTWPLKHRILGTINFDVPFLGMHPGVVKSGLASIFKSSEEVEDKYAMDEAASSHSGTSASTTRTDTLWTPNKQDPNYNPSFQNDVALPMRKGWQNAWHFINKHSDHLYSSTKQLVTSHMEFGGAMANYGELKARYGKIRALEETDETVRKSVIKTRNAPPRVRFVNYYTASTGRVSKKKSPSRQRSANASTSKTSLTPSMAEDATRGRTTQGTDNVEAGATRSQSPRISLEDHSDGKVVKKEPEVPSSDDEDWAEAAESLTIGDGSDPPLPAAPPPLDVSFIKDPAIRQLVEQEHARAAEAYERAVQDRANATADQTFEERRTIKKSADQARNAAKDAKQAKNDAKHQNDTLNEEYMSQSQREELRLAREKERMEAEGRRLRGEQEPDFSAPSCQAQAWAPPSLAPTVSQTSTISSSPSSSRSRSPAQGKQKKPKKDRKFCTLPPKDSNGERDPTWVRIFMENVDEVGAHCGLFFVDERYERLVGEVAERIEEWVREDMGTLAAFWKQELG